MNQRLLTSLSQIAGEQLLAEKRLLAPSRLVGRQWIEALAREGVAAVNFRVATLAHLAGEIAVPAATERGLQPLPREAGLLLVQSLWPKPTPKYFTTADYTSLCGALYRSIQTLRAAGVEQLDPDRFEDRAKGEDLACLLEAYQEALREQSWIDEAEQTRLAIELLSADAATVLPDETLVLLPESLPLAGLNRQLIAAIPDAQLVRLDDSVDRSPHRLQIARAVGEINEVRRVFREIVAEGRSLDEVELVHTDGRTYDSLIYETVMSHLVDADAGEFDAADLPVTFSNGVAATYTRPGSALAGWLWWQANQHTQAGLIPMIQDGLLNWPLSGFSFAALGALLRPLGIGYGADRYVTRVEAELTRLRDENAALTPKGRLFGDDEAVEAKRQRTARRRRGLQHLKNRLGGLLKISTAADGDELLQNAEQFLAQVVRCSGALDHQARAVMSERIRHYRSLRKTLSLQATTVRAWLESLPGSVAVNASGPRPGALHVAGLDAGGHSGRTLTFILGMDESRFPGAASPDPVLLDDERASLGGLPTRDQRMEERIRQFQAMLAGVNGEARLSYACWEPVEDREQFPSPIVLDLFRSASNRPETDLSELNRSLPAPTSYAIESIDQAIHPADWWTNRLGVEGVLAPETVLQESFPRLKESAAATRGRQSQEFTRFDGWISEVDPKHLPSRGGAAVVSSSSLETLGRCPLAYFFRYLLGVRPLDEWSFDPDRWLDPLKYGLLLHEVFHQFLERLIQQDTLPPSLRRDRAMLLQILRDVTSRYRDETPPPNESSYRRQVDQLERAVLIFLSNESVFCRDSTPRFVEASFGLRLGDDAARGPLDREDPVELSLSEDRSLQVRGKIDRVDQLPGEPARYAIWDYKTGSDKRYERGGPFQQGRVVQNFLYAEVLQSVLAGRDEEAQVQQFGFFFPGVRSWGRRIGWSREELKEGRAIVDALCDIIHNGAFLATDKVQDCYYCDYRPVCGDVYSLSSASRGKLDTPANTQLAASRRLRRNG